MAPKGGRRDSFVQRLERQPQDGSVSVSVLSAPIPQYALHVLTFEEQSLPTTIQRELVRCTAIDLYLSCLFAFRLFRAWVQGGSTT